MGSIRLLHVDDDPALLDLAATALERQGSIAVASERNPDAVLDRLEADPFDCVVTDYDMPGTDGLELLRSVRAAHGDLPFILFTGKGSEEIASEAVSAGADDYIQKQGGLEQYDLLANRVRNAVERRRAERERRESERRLATLLDNVPGMAYRCRNEPSWPMEFVSEGCRELTGYAPDRLESGDVVWAEDVLHPEDAGEMWAPVQESLEAREPFEVTYRILTADGETKWVWERGRGVYTDEVRRADDYADGAPDATDEAPDGVVALEGFISDITDRKRYESQLERQNERLDSFARAVSHDLRTPLNVAAGHIEEAATVCDTHHVTEAAEALDVVERTIDDVLALARSGGDAVTDPVFLPGLAREAWQTVDPDRGTFVVDDALDEHGVVLASEDALRRLLENLFRNAVEHGSTNPQQAGDAVDRGTTADQPAADGGRGVTVELSRTDDGTGFVVADDGPGIPEAEREKVFDEGYTRDDAGTGIGLAVVRRVAEAHGWAVRVEESAMGGARFVVTGVEYSS